MTNDKQGSADKIVGSSELLERCPFCGTQPSQPIFNGSFYRAECRECEFVMQRTGLWLLIAAWNRRY